MPFVVDASLTLAWYLPDEQTPTALTVRERLAREDGLVPAHWWYEVRNGMLMAERRGRTTEHLVASALANLGRWPIRQVRQHNDAPIFTIAREYRLSFYDAAYLLLAQHESAALATLDGSLAKAAAAEGVPLLIAS